ncbi:DUF2169 domain-containing protein [Nitratireductor sp. ZSWI3]|uniref:DUF2169 family type VI secretion system accessory protein n=1 Tax=Nitratireductor sp. ZSWI3 TaxID=2966359 RepID=UPI00214F6987|nr:DUF2169 domain-containing protein [Nitratireductor sp. ZSWI3]MCR4266328.1 DUF2169 domain-containing protein [Nitratireductor sp. ZSWI3]
MWDVTNRTPFSVFSGFDRDKDGKAYWLVWVKATFLMRHERPCLFEPEQIALFREPVYRGPPESTDLLADNDICFPKQRPDVVVTAHSRPPQNTAPGELFDAGVSIGDWSKTVTVLPPMRWSDRLRPERIGDNDSVLLGFCNAFGGSDRESGAARAEEYAENPIGRGFWTSRQAAHGKLLPRIVEAGKTVDRWDELLTPVSLACLPKERPRRAQYSGTYDETWMRRKSPLLPDDFDLRYWQCVDADQQLEAEPAAGSRVTLTNIMVKNAEPDAGVFVGELPRLEFELFTRFKGKWQETEMRLQTIHLLAAQGLVTLTYCGALPIQAAANDVLVDESEIALRGHTGFRVRPQDVGRFDPMSAEMPT